MSVNEEPVDDDDIYDVMPTDKTVSDINKLKNMFEQKPMGVYTPGKPPPNNKIFTGTGSGENVTNKPTVAEKPPFKTTLGGARVNIPANFTAELQKHKQFSGPQLPSKTTNRTSVVNGEVVKSNEAPPLIPKKGGKGAPPPVAAKTGKPAPLKSSPPAAKEKLSAPGTKPKPTTPVRKDSNENHVISKSPPESPRSPTENTASPKSPTEGKFDNNIEYLSDPIEGPNGLKYRMVKCQKSPGSPPVKPSLPAKVAIHDILQQYADDDDMYDDVITDDAAARPVSVIPEFTEDEEKELARQAKTVPPEPQVPGDTRADDTRTNRTPSMMSTGSDIYESFDDVEEGGDVKL